MPRRTIAAKSMSPQGQRSQLLLVEALKLASSGNFRCVWTSCSDCLLYSPNRLFAPPTRKRLKD